jgi:hypothetical protein
MHLSPGSPHRLQARPSTRELLGPAHPLTRAEDKLTALHTPSLMVAGFLCAGVAALLDGLATGRLLVIAAAVVGGALGCRAALLLDSRREHALELIAEGHGDLPLDAVARQRRRLLDPARRRRLARAFDEIRDEALHPPPRQARVRPIFDARVITATAPELTAIARLLRDDNVRLSGVALAQQLLTQGGSPLFRSNVHLLRDELHRILHHLAR